MSQLVFQVFFLYIFTEIILQSKRKENPGIKNSRGLQSVHPLCSLCHHQLMFLKSLMSCDIVVCPGDPVRLI